MSRLTPVMSSDARGDARRSCWSAQRPSASPLKISYDFDMKPEEENETKRRAISAGAQPLAWILALAYLLVIAYASLQPFSGWRVPPEEIRRFLSAPWPAYITLQDVLLNIAAYVPLAFFFAIALLARFGQVTAVLLAIACAFALSTTMEIAQSFMPTRVASNVDILTNTLGGTLGALAAPLFAQTHRPGMRVAQWRREWFVYGRSADVGLVIVCLWLLTQLYPLTQLFGTGRVRDTLDLPTWIFHTPQAQVAAQAAVTGLNLLGIGLIVLALTRTSKPRLKACSAVVALAVALKALAGFALAKSAGLLAWLTPGVVLGIVGGSLLIYGATRLSRRAQWVAAAASFGAAIAAINVGPDNPYQTLPPQLLAQGPTHFLSVSSMVRALSELWPFLALAYVIAAIDEPEMPEA